jgi:hypothetical protein
MSCVTQSPGDPHRRRHRLRSCARRGRPRHRHRRTPAPALPGVDTGSTGRSRPQARPCATPQARRRPVNPPGPAPKAMPSSCARVMPGFREQLMHPWQQAFRAAAGNFPAALDRVRRPATRRPTSVASRSRKPAGACDSGAYYLRLPRMPRSVSWMSAGISTVLALSDLARLPIAWMYFSPSM